MYMMGESGQAGEVGRVVPPKDQIAVGALTVVVVDHNLHPAFLRAPHILGELKQAALLAHAYLQVFVFPTVGARNRLRRGRRVELRAGGWRRLHQGCFLARQ